MGTRFRAAKIGEHHSFRGVLKKALAGVAALAVTFGISALALVGPAPAAQADMDSDGYQVTLLHNGNPISSDTPEVRNGDTFKFKLQYNDKAAGKTVTLGFPGGEVPTSFPNNDAIESFTTNPDGTVTIQFKASGVPQGLLELELELDVIENSEGGTVDWVENGDTRSVPVIFVKDGDEKQNVQNGFSKSLQTASNLNQFIQTGPDGIFTGLDPAIEGEIITYTLTINTAEGTTRTAPFDITDTLPDGLEYVSPLNVTASETTWTNDGYTPVPNQSRNFIVDSSSATSFSGHIDGDIEGPSVLTLTYQVEVTDADAIKAILQDSFDALDGAPGGFNTGEHLRNTAKFGEDGTAHADLGIGGTVVGPCVGDCNGKGPFTKQGEHTTTNAIVEADGTIVPGPVDASYTFHANLEQWDGHSPNFTLNSNVILTDTLPAGASWDLSGSVPVTGLYDNDGSAISALTPASPAPADAAAFAGDAHVGEYWLDGQTLRVNLGKFNDGTAHTNAEFVLDAQWHSVDRSLTDGNVGDGNRFILRNTATFNYGRDYTTPNVDRYVVAPDESGNPVNDSSAFSKIAPESITARPDHAVEVP